MKKDVATIPEEIRETWKPTEEEIFTEFGVTEEYGRIYRVDRPFFLTVEDGPPKSIPKGSFVRVASRMGEELFYAGKASPVDFSETFEATRDFRTVDADGKWLVVKRGDIIGLTRDEALALLRKGEVKEKKGELK